MTKITIDRAVVEQALESMENNQYAVANQAPHRDVMTFNAAITALRAALVEDAMQKFTDVSQEIEAALAEPVQEPVAWEQFHEHMAGPSYRAPPQRKPLTEEEIQAAWDSVDMRHPRGNETRIAFARAVERAHGIGGQP